MPEKILRYLREHIWPRECPKSYANGHANGHANGTERVTRAVEDMAQEVHQFRVATEQLQQEPDPLAALVANMRRARQSDLGSK